MSEYIFVHLLDKKPVGSELGRSMPLHMTILHWFEGDSEQAAVQEIFGSNLVLKTKKNS